MKIKNQILLSVFLIGFIQAAFVIELDLITYIVGAISYLLAAIILIVLSKINYRNDFEARITIQIYLLLSVIAIIRGFFEAQNYWEWKYLILGSTLILSLPILSYVGSNRHITQLIYYNYIKYLLPASFFIYFAALNSENTDGFGRFLSPLYLIILFFPVISKKWKLIVICLMTISFLSDIDARSNLIRILASSLIMLLYYTRHYVKKRFLEFIRITLFTAPLVFLVLGVTNTFNIFKINEDRKGEFVTERKLSSGEERTSDFASDSRTFLYQEVIQSGIDRNTWIWGESAVSGYKTEYFEDMLSSKGRIRSEVGILNVFNMLGIVGVFAFTLVYYMASFLCVMRSNNYLCKLIGIFIAFRWTFSWIEEFTNFDMNYFFLWLTIGLCFSISFRKMNDDDMKVWIRGIFDKKYSFSK
ncbi:MAG: hypothetical protein K0M40_10585 [Prolixibacteraceae bacterium]|nr:hypothetical protein [Prolixibacteraceae bacterium]